MHISAQRLFRAAASPPFCDDSPTKISERLDASPQTVTNWQKRGVSVDGALQAQLIYGCDANWILHGKKSATESQSQTARFDDKTMESAIDLLNMLGAARPDDSRFHPLKWRTISMIAEVIGKRGGRDQRQLIADVLEALKG